MTNVIMINKNKLIKELKSNPNDAFRLFKPYKSKEVSEFLYENYKEFNHQTLEKILFGVSVVVNIRLNELNTNNPQKELTEILEKIDNWHEEKWNKPVVSASREEFVKQEARTGILHMVDGFEELQK